MDDLALVALFSAAFINAALPGPCTILTATATASGGGAAGLRTTWGILGANLVLLAVSLAVMFGALSLSPYALVPMKWGGIVVLIVMALRLLRSAPDAPTTVDCGRRGLAEFSCGLLTGFSSPFNLVFLLALLPQFVPANPGVDGIAKVVVTVLLAVAAAQACVMIVGLGSRNALGCVTSWLERAGAFCLLGFAGAAVLTPLA